MRRRNRAILAGIALAVAAVVTGSVVALGRNGTGGAKPTGEQTVVRIQPEDGAVSCGSGSVNVDIYLDDLTARASPHQADASYGVSAFQFLLRYDPAIVRIANTSDVQLNAGLDLEDADRDGVVRGFIPLSNIDDGAGRAGLGGASIVPSSRGGEDNLEEGLDPVAKGEPLLLLTVRFLPVGQGASALTLEPEGALPPQVERARLLDPSGKPYEPIVLQNATLTVRGGDCPAGPFATPRPTVGPTATELVPPTWTPVPWRTVAAPDAPEAGRTDCPQDWVAYADPKGRFSICYSASYGATASDFALNAHSPQAPGQVENLVSVVISWGARPYFSLPPSEENCALVADSLLRPRGSRAITLELSGRFVSACLSEGRVNSIQGSTPLAKDRSETMGFINFTVNYSGPDPKTSSDAMAVLETLRITFR